MYAKENYKAVDIPGNLATFVTLFCVKVWSLRCSFFKKFSKCIHHVRFILADINQNIAITKLHFICDTSVAIKTNITEDELQK